MRRGKRVRLGVRHVVPAGAGLDPFLVDMERARRLALGARATADVGGGTGAAAVEWVLLLPSRGENGALALQLILACRELLAAAAGVRPVV